MFENISIGIKTFLRDEQLFNTVDAIRTNLPGAQMIIADCGDMTEAKDGLYAELEREGHIHIDLPFDAGFGRMSNAIARDLERPYLLVGSDDFDFSTAEAREGIEKLQHVLKTADSIDIASGRVNGRPYEFWLSEQDGVVTEREAVVGDYPLLKNDDFRIIIADLTVNYSLIRGRVFDAFRIGWDEDVKIGGGEHGAFFVDCKRAGLVTVYVTGVNINEQKVKNSARYNLYRRRAMDPARPCFDKRGITKYVLGNGQVDYAKY
jgi:hypothetical protein